MGILLTCCSSVAPAVSTVFIEGNRDDPNVYVRVCVCVPGVCYLGYYRTESAPNRATGCSGEKVETAEQMTLFTQNSRADLNMEPDLNFYSKSNFLVSNLWEKNEYSFRECWERIESLNLCQISGAAYTDVVFRGLTVCTGRTRTSSLSETVSGEFTSESPWVKETPVVIQMRENEDCISWRSLSNLTGFSCCYGNKYLEGVGPWNGTQPLCIVEGYPPLPPTQHSALLCLQSDITF